MCYTIFICYLGTQEEAAEAYDIAAIKFRGLNAVTNFDISRYDVKSIASSNLPIGGGSGGGGGVTKTNNNNSSCESLLLSDNDRGGRNRDRFKQQTEENGQFWSGLRQYDQSQGLNNNNIIMSDDGKNPNMLFYESSNNNSATTATATTLEVEFSTNTNVRNNNNNGYFEEQQNTRRSTVVPVVSRIGLNSNGGTTFDGTSYGNWISATPSTTGAAAVHSFQTAKQNLSVVFQTPIFGME